MEIKKLVVIDENEFNEKQNKQTEELEKNTQLNAAAATIIPAPAPGVGAGVGAGTGTGTGPTLRTFAALGGGPTGVPATSRSRKRIRYE